MARRIRLPMPALDPILDKSEKGLVDRALSVLRRTRPRDSALLWAQLKRVALIGVTLDEAPSLVVPASYGGAALDEEALVETIARLDRFGGDLEVPEKAIIARAFLTAKISLLRGFLTALTSCEEESGEPELAAEIKAELAQSIYTAIAGEILVALLHEEDISRPVKLRAARQLVSNWERALSVEIDDFCPMLEAAWGARSRTVARFGTLLAASEYLHLIQEDCPAEFLDFFTRDGTSKNEFDAFEEFLFDLTHEELGFLRAAMRGEKRGAVDADFVSRAVMRPVAGAGSAGDPDSLFRSYRRRRAAAEGRRLLNADGPPHVAEEYIMIHILSGAGGQG